MFWGVDIYAAGDHRGCLENAVVGQFGPREAVASKRHVAETLAEVGCQGRGQGKVTSRVLCLELEAG